MLANGIEFNHKEAYMLPLNDFINRNMQVRDDFLEAVSVCIALYLIAYYLQSLPPEGKTPDPISSMEKVVSESIPFILDHIMDPNKNYENLQKILKSLKQYKAEYIIPELQDCLLAIDPAYKKILGLSVITEITGLKVKRGGFDLFKAKSPTKETKDNGKEKDSGKDNGKDKEGKDRSVGQDMSSKLAAAKESLKLSSRQKKESPRSPTGSKWLTT